jgi:hypothetical protein
MPRIANPAQFPINLARILFEHKGVQMLGSKALSGRAVVHARAEFIFCIY